MQKNAGRPITKIVSIPYLAQAVLAIVQQEPDNSRARPSSLLNEDSDYLKIFGPDYPIEMFLKCALVMKRIDSFLRSSVLTTTHKNNVKFYVAMDAVARALKKTRPAAKDIGEMSMDTISDSLLDNSLERVLKVFSGLGASDQVAKGKDFVKILKDDLEGEFGLA
jgi:hypothetical protein